jgi:hypothetical protein
MMFSDIGWLALQITASGAVGAVNLAMAIHTGTTNNVFAWELRHTGSVSACQTTLETSRINACWRSACMGAVVAVLTKKRCA